MKGDHSKLALKDPARDDWETSYTARLEDHERKIKDWNETLAQMKDDHAKQLVAFKSELSHPATPRSPSSFINMNREEEQIQEIPTEEASVEHGCIQTRVVKALQATAL